MASGEPAPLDPGGGLRQRKKRETRQRIAQAGLELFIAQGYEETTLDAVAAAAGISRRTFFYYFKSKDDILLSLQSDGADALCEAVVAAPADANPLDTIGQALVALSAPYPSDEMRAIDRVMRSSEALQARKQANYVGQEQQLFHSLCVRWPDPLMRGRLRLIAMMSVGAMRLSMDVWREENGARPLAAVVTEMFETLKARV